MQFSCVLIDDGVKVWVRLWRGFKFSVKDLKIEFYGIFKQKEQFNAIFFLTCLDIAVVHDSNLMVWRCFAGESYLKSLTECGCTYTLAYHRMLPQQIM